MVKTTIKKKLTTATTSFVDFIANILVLLFLIIMVIILTWSLFTGTIEKVNDLANLDNQIFLLSMVLLVFTLATSCFQLASLESRESRNYIKIGKYFLFSGVLIFITFIIKTTDQVKNEFVNWISNVVLIYANYLFILLVLILFLMQIPVIRRLFD